MKPKEVTHYPFDARLSDHIRQFIPYGLHKMEFDIYFKWLKQGNILGVRNGKPVLVLRKGYNNPTPLD